VPGANGFIQLLSRSDLAIDDVSFDACDPSVIANQTLACDFEGGTLCSWYQQPNDKDDFDWTLTNNAKHSQGTGPGVDHTTGSGKS